MYLGIDLGTSNSAVVGNENGELRLFKTIDGMDTLPSVIMQERNGGLYVGKRAYDQLQTSPQSVVVRFKRLLGTKTELKIATGDHSISPEEASAEVLRTLMKQVDSAVGSVEIEGCIVTVPAAFDQLQSEATARAANAAGLDRVGLLQEPIAAAMASLEKISGKDGLFLVYDLGGGTFDVALVRSISNTVTIEAHEGIKMLGGGDFDRSILNAIIHPWVHTHFDLADDANTDAAYRRMFAIARHAAEHAKIELSSREETTIYVSEDETRVLDRSGKEIFIEIPFNRTQLNDLIIARIDQSIELCRKTISDNGYNSDDIDRIVLIGGPSHMSIVREYVPQEIGIPVDLQTDPMTAVARGAAIYAESREWTGSVSARKAARNRKQVGANVKVSYDYEARVTTDNARVRATGEGDVSSFRVSATTDGGRDYGEQDLSGSPVFSIALNDSGATIVRMVVTDVAGRKVDDACAEFTIVRPIAEAASMPCTHTISVKVAKNAGTEVQNRLSPIVKKGTPMPQKGTTVFHANRRLDPSNPGHIDVELFQQAEGVEDFESNLFIGPYRIDAIDLPQDGQTLRVGDEVLLHWKLSDSQTLSCAVEIPSLGTFLDNKNFYVNELAELDFGGNNGREIASDALVVADHELENLSDLLDGQSETEITDLRRRLNDQLDRLRTNDDADEFRSITEEARHIRQDMSRIRHRPDIRAALLNLDLVETQSLYEKIADHDQKSSSGRRSKLHATADQALSRGDVTTAETAIDELKSINSQILREIPEFIVGQFEYLATRKHTTVDVALHEKYVVRGKAAISTGDIEDLREVIFDIYQNLAEPAGAGDDIAALAGLRLAD